MNPYDIPAVVSALLGIGAVIFVYILSRKKRTHLRRVSKKA